MDPHEFDSKLQELRERFENDPSEFELAPVERERLEDFLGETIMELEGRHGAAHNPEPLLGTPMYPLHPAEWALLKVILGELPPALTVD